jgi:hypothetical protein
LLEEYIKKNKMDYDPTWSIDTWVLDSLFGNNIFKSTWNPAIFISQGSENVSILNVNVNQRRDKGALKNFF